MRKVFVFGLLCFDTSETRNNTIYTYMYCIVLQFQNDEYVDITFGLYIYSAILHVSIN